MTTPLEQNPCRSLCDWVPTGGAHDGLPLFTCTGCGSEWVRSQAWTPANADGTVPAEVQTERDRT